MKSLTSIVASALAALSITANTAEAKAVYAHYMVGGVDDTTDHAKQDVEGAQAMGFDGFALNVQAPKEPWAISCIQQVFEAAAGTGFKLFFSLDMNRNDNVDQFASLFDYFDNDAYLKSEDGRPFVSTFWGGNFEDQWRSLKEQHNMYFVPSFDDIPDYYEDPTKFFNQWGDIVDGAFNWETAWPPPVDTPMNVSSASDEEFQQAALAADKDFMMAISPLQYKHCCGGYHYYRIGEGNLPERMTQILNVKPELVEFITWNDAGESHYIGHIWEEAFNTAPDILEYANTDEFPHYAWGPLVTSFINAFKEGVDASQKSPPGDAPVGAMWHRGTLKSCSSERPAHADAALDAVVYAFVLPGSLEGATIRVSSGDQVIGEHSAVAGLNYATVGGMTTGHQKVEIVQGDNVVATAAGTVDVVESLPDFCNFNFYVNALE